MENYFKTQSVAERIWSIAGPANDLMYLIAGNKSAMLVDTGMGIGNLAGVVKGLTNLPVIVVNTHGHPDHAGGNSSYEEVWLHPKDDSMMRALCTDEYRLKDLKASIGDKSPEYGRMVAGLIHFQPPRINPIKGGQIFDLGDRQFEVLETPGHTPGSVCLLNIKEKIIFTGDSVVATPVWLYLEHSVLLKTYYESLRKIKERENSFEILFPGHFPAPLGKEYLDDLIMCTEEVLHSPRIGESIKTYAGEGLLWKHGKGSIIYKPEKVT
jgi:hydroxyacylglutathione hydrolase